MKERRIWEKPIILAIGVEKTQTSPPGNDPQPNDVWCPLHNKWHGQNHSQS